MAEPMPSGIATSDRVTDLDMESSGPIPAPLLHQLPWHARFGLSWSTGTVPIVLVLLLGSAMGPRGLAILTPRVLGVIDPVIPVAVAALGILAGLELTRAGVSRRGVLIGAATIQALCAGAAVGAGVALLAWRTIGLDPASVSVVALIAAVCAAMSASLPAADPDRLRPPSTWVRDFDTLLPTIVGATVLASLHSASALATVGLAAQAAMLALVISATAWFLLVDTLPITEQRVFSIAALLLIGGIADYLSLSALASGLLAGLFWGAVGGVARDCMERDVRYVRHPLVVLMLLTAGARTTLSPAILVLAVAYLVLRIAGKLAGSWLAKRVPTGVAMPSHLGLSLLPPSLFGVAFALNAAPMLGALAPVVLSAVVIGSIGSQLAAAMWRSWEQE